MGNLPLRTYPTEKTVESNDRVSTVSSTATKISNYGKTLLSSTAAGTYIMESPIPGVRKVLVSSSGTSAVARTVTGETTTVLFITNGSTNTNLVFTVLNAGIEIEGRTSLIWDVISTSGGATLS